MKKLNLFGVAPFLLLALVTSSCSNMDEPLAQQDSVQSLNTQSEELRSASISAPAYGSDVTRSLNNIALEYVNNAKTLL